MFVQGNVLWDYCWNLGAVPKTTTKNPKTILSEMKQKTQLLEILIKNKLLTCSELPYSTAAISKKISVFRELFSALIMSVLEAEKSAGRWRKVILPWLCYSTGQQEKQPKHQQQQNKKRY